MKKRLLSLFLSVVMVLALLPVKTYAADGHTHNYEKGICECGAHNGEHGEWTEWTQTASLPAESGYFYLAADVALTSTWKVPTGTTYLCLNGHLISPASGVETIALISVPKSATLNLYDCSTEKHFYKVGSDGLWTLDTGATEGTPFDSLTARPDAGTVIEVVGGCITGGKSETNNVAGGVSVSTGGVFTMNGGNLVGNSTAFRGGAVNVLNGAFNLKSGNILGNLALGDGDVTGGGAGVCVNGGTLTMAGGNISFNTVPNYAAGGIMVLDISGGSFIMSDGNIKYNYANGNGGGVCTNRPFTMTGGCIEGNVSSAGGGGVRVTAKGSMTATGGQIINNSSTSDGGGVNMAGTVTLGGTIKINGNKKGTGSSAVTQNIFLPSGKTVTIATGDNVPAVGMSVGITTGNTNGIGKFTGTADAAYTRYFIPDNTILVTAHVTDHLELTTGWKALKNALNGNTTATVPGVFEIDEDGVIKLVADVKAASDDSHLVVSGTRTVDLNGHAIDRNLSTAKSGGNVIYINPGAVLTVRDSSGTDTSNGTGKITGGNNSTTDYTSPGCAGGVHNYGGTFYFEGGSICGNKTVQTGGGVYNLAGGTVVMSGYATISDNTASSWSGGFENNNYNSGSKSSSLTMKDHSRIVNNKAKLGGGADFCDSTTLVMQDYSSISGNTATDTGGGIYLYDGTTSIIMSGHATVSDNTATNAGSGICCGKNTVKVIVGGSASVTGNKLSSETENNVSLKAGGVITISTGDDAPTDDMSVGITTATAPTATAPVAFTGENSTDYHNNFFPDAGRLLQDVSYVSKKLYLSIPKISVSQTGTNPVYGTAMPSNEFYSVSTNGFGDAPDLKLEWKSGTGTSTVWGDDAPAGITAGLTNGKISIATDATLNAGTYTFRVTNGENEFTTGTTKNPMFVTSAETVFTVGKASLTVTAKDKSIIYGEAPANDGVEYSGFVNSETADVLGGMLVYDYSANGTAYVSGGSVGTYDIIPSGLSSDNYEITFEKGSLKVDRRQLTVTGTEVEAQRIYDGTVVINVSSIGYLGNIANSDSVTLSATAACADAGAGKDKQVTVTYTISGTKADNYIAPAADSSFTTEIIKATPTVSAPTALSIGVHSITLNEQSGPCGTEYGYNTVNETPSAWQESTEFTGLDKLTAYYFFTKFKGNENYNEAVSAGRSITTADPNHQHVWSYSASGNMITAECGNSDGEHDGSLTSTLTLVAPTLTTYAETGKSAEVTVSGEIAGVSTPDVEYYKGSIRLGAAPTEAGSYTAKLTVGDATAVLDYVIGKANAVITVDTTPIVKDFGEAVTLPAAGSNFGTVSCDKTAEDLVNAGSYTVTYEVSDSDNYNGDIKTVSVTINKLAVDEPAVTGTYVYNGSEQDAVVSGKETFMTETGDVKGTDAGTYTITYILDGNHCWRTGSDGNVTWNIDKAGQNAAAPTASASTIDTVILNVQNGQGSTMYGYNTTDALPAEWQESTKFTGLSESTVYYFFTKFTGNGNYLEAVSSGAQFITASSSHVHEWSYSASDNLIIAECLNSDNGHGTPLTATLTLTAPELTAYGETGKSAEATVSGEIDGVVIPDIEYYKGSDKLDGAPTDMGRYTAKLTVGGVTAALDYEIGKAKAVITVDTTPIVKNYGEELTLPVATSNFGSVSCDKTAADMVNAGSYTVTYTVSGTDNYDGDTKTVSVTINKLAVDEPIVTGSYEYTGAEQSAVVSGKEAYMTETGDTAATNAGSYTIVYTLDGNHYWADGSDGTVIWSIAKTAQTAPEAPEAENKNDAGVTLKVQSGQGMTLYGCSTSDMLPSAWQESPVISGLTESTTYYFFVKFAGNSNYLEAVSSGTQITTDSSVCAHSDVDKDHYCDICNEKISEHIDVDRDHLCDICLTRLSSHDDANHDHYCDFCRIKMSDHHDADNHYCDFCGIKLTEHYDNNKDYICDLCGYIYPEKAEADSRETNVISVDSDNRITTDAINEMIDSIIENGETELVISTDGKTEGGSQSGSDGKTEGGNDEASVTEKLSLDKAAIKTLAKADGIDSVTIQTDVADIKLSAACIDSLNSQAEGDITLSVTQTVKKGSQADNAAESEASQSGSSQSGSSQSASSQSDGSESDAGMVIYDFSIVDDAGNKITSLGKKKIKITVPVPEGMEGTESAVVLPDGKGGYSTLKGTVNSDGTITFETKKLDEIIIMDKADAEKMIQEAEQKSSNVISPDDDNTVDSDTVKKMISKLEENGKKTLIISTADKTKGGSQNGSDGKTEGGSQSGSDDKSGGDSQSDSDGKTEGGGTDGKTEGGSDEVSVTEKLSLEKAAIKTLAKADGIDSVTIQTDVADIKLSAACIDSLNSRAEGDVTLSVSRTVKDAGSESGNAKNEKNSADEKVYYNFSLTDEKGNEITTLDRKKITITVPVPAELQGKDPVCVFSDGEGHYSPVKGKVNKDGTITFETNYIAEVVIMSQKDADESYNYIHDMQTLNVHVKKCTDTTVTIEWGDYSYADGYIVYGSYCNEGDEKHTVRKLATIKDPSATEYTISGLESGQYYKFRVTAYRQVNGKYGVVKSYLVHARTSENGKDGNDSVDIEINDIRKSGISLKKKETYVIDADQYNPDGIKFRHVGIRYESSDTSVATVAKDGKIKAVGKGKCLIYVFAENGAREEIKVTVK